MDLGQLHEIRNVTKLSIMNINFSFFEQTAEPILHKSGFLNTMAPCVCTLLLLTNVVLFSSGALMFSFATRSLSLLSTRSHTKLVSIKLLGGKKT